MADTMDSKSIVSNDMWVRLPPPVFAVLRKVFRHGIFFGNGVRGKRVSRKNRESGEDPERLPPL